METYIGAICLFGFNFAPIGWSFCSGNLLPIAQNEALFTLLGTTYGGDGQVTFALPNLQSRFPIGQGQGPGLSRVQIGETSGTESTTLTVSNMPMHNHILIGSVAQGNQPSPTGNVLAAGISSTGEDVVGYTAPPATAILNQHTVGFTGENTPVAIMNPFLGLNFCIALEGIFPSQG